MSYYIISPRGPSTKAHASLDDAQTEARRLALQHPQTEFRVCRLDSVFVASLSVQHWRADQDLAAFTAARAEGERSVDERSVDLSKCVPGQKLRLRDGRTASFVGKGANSAWPAHVYRAETGSGGSRRRYSYVGDGSWAPDRSPHHHDIVEVLPLETPAPEPTPDKQEIPPLPRFFRAFDTPEGRIDCLTRMLADEYDENAWGNGFDWASLPPPQGWSFWNDQDDDEKASPEGRKILQAWLDQLLDEEAGLVPEDFLPRAAERVLGGATRDLDATFYWTESPQGDPFWRAQYDAEKLSPKGERILKTWLRKAGKTEVAK